MLHPASLRRALVVAVALSLPPDPAAAQRLDGLPIDFVANAGQWPDPVLFAADAPTLRARVEADAIGVDALVTVDGSPRTASLRLAFAGAAPDAGVVPLAPRPGVRHYFLGADPAAWRTDVPTFDGVRWEGLYPGIDVDLEERDGTVAYTLRVAADADLAAFGVRVEGADEVALGADGALVARSALGTLTQSAPLAWYERADGAREPAAVRFRARADGRFGFELAAPRRGLPLVVDPGLVWGTLLGGSAEDRVDGLALDGVGGVYVGGYTASPNFPYPGGPLPDYGSRDGYAARIDATGLPFLDWVAVVGGVGSDEPSDLAVGADGRVHLTGTTTSSDLPTTPGAHDSVFDGSYPLHTEGFVACLREDGAELVYSTYLGGADTRLVAIAIDDLGRATVVGESFNRAYPSTPGAYDAGFPSGSAVLTRLAADGAALDYSTHVGGPGPGGGPTDVALGPDGAAIVAYGYVDEPFPVTPGAFAQGPAGAGVQRFSPDGSALLASTYVGGADYAGESVFAAVAVGPGGEVVLGGYSRHPEYPVTAGAHDAQHSGALEWDAVVTVLDPDLTTVLRSTFYGGGDQVTEALAVDASGVVTIAGYNWGGSTLPVTPGCLQASPGLGGQSAFVARFDPSLEKLLYGSYLNGTVATGPGLGSRAFEVAAAPDGSAVVAGRTIMDDFPTSPHPIQGAGAGGDDGFVTSLDMLPVGAARFGASTPACGSATWIGVTEQPSAGAAGFAATASGAPPGTVGVLGVAAAPDPSGVSLLGVEVFVDLASVLVVLPVLTDAGGWCERALPLPAGTEGARAALQFLFANTPTCGGAGTFSASDALLLTIQ